MTQGTCIVVILICIAAIVALTATFIWDMLKESGFPAIRPDVGSVQVSADAGSVVTVRKVGGTTRVEIRQTWQGAVDEEQWEDGTALAPTPAEITATSEPELYREYMSPKTSATRKYEIIDYVYGIGLTLPLIPGLHEQYLKEQARKAPGKEPARRKLHIDRSVGNTQMEDIDDPDVPVRLTPEQPES